MFMFIAICVCVYVMCVVLGIISIGHDAILTCITRHLQSLVCRLRSVDFEQKQQCTTCFAVLSPCPGYRKMKALGSQSLCTYTCDCTLGKISLLVHVEDATNSSCMLCLRVDYFFAHSVHHVRDIPLTLPWPVVLNHL